ncbi:MAG: SHOCT domain-containing protein [Candidatus Aenigmarchaeota archaeon]|nr:SHOCT domain-containing protein [Candidatus Aenigmarchaeota archaeon]
MICSIQPNVRGVFTLPAGGPPNKEWISAHCEGTLRELMEMYPGEGPGGPSQPPSQQSQMSQEPDAMSILKQRYARGEISKEEYDRMYEDLMR